MTRTTSTWIAAGLLGLGVLATFGFVRPQRSLSLREPLAAAVPSMIDGLHSRDIVIPEDERKVAGMTTYLMRGYGSEDSPRGFTVYVGYYDSQAQGKTIHSPKNCLPGAGWEALTQGRARIATALGTVPVNRYLIANGQARALVLYWYQGRGRVAANEYRVKWDLLRDQALRRRSDEALVRVLVPIVDSEAAAYATAVEVAKEVMPTVQKALPG